MFKNQPEGTELELWTQPEVKFLNIYRMTLTMLYLLMWNVNLSTLGDLGDKKESVLNTQYISVKPLTVVGITGI